MTKQEMVYSKLCLIASRSLRSGVTRLPSEAELCRMFGVSRQTLRSALRRLREEGVLTSLQGSGYYLTGTIPGGDNHIVLLIPDDEAYIYPSLTSDISRYFSSRSFRVSVVLTGDDVNTERAALQSLLESPPRGIIVQCIHSSIPTPNDDLYRQLENRGTALIFIESRYPNLNSGVIAGGGSAEAGFIMTRHFLDMGHTAIAWLGVEDDMTGYERCLGYCRALLAAGLRIDSRLIRRIPSSLVYSTKDGDPPKYLYDLLSALPHEVTGIICQNDKAAYMVITALEDMGFQVPSSVSIAGFDNSYLTRAGRIRLTTIGYSGATLAAQICSAMTDLLTGKAKESAAPVSWKLIKGGTAMRVGDVFY